MSFRQDRTNPSTAVSNWHGRSETPKGWPSTRVSTWTNGGLFSAGGGTGTFEPIATGTGDNSSSSFSFTSIPATFTDLKVLVQRKGQYNQTSPDVPYITMNDEINYNYGQMAYKSSGGWTITGSNGAAKLEMQQAGVYNSPNTMPLTYWLDVNSYVATGINKPIMFNGGKPYSTQLASSNDWFVGQGVASMNANASTELSAVTKITCTNGYGSKWVSTDSLTLFGIKDS